MDKKTKDIDDDEFYAYLNHVLTLIDEIFTKDEVELKDRPLLAAKMFVETCVQNVSGNSTENFITEPWFKYIIEPTKAWFDTKYGSLLSPARNQVIGVMMYCGMFLELKINSTLSFRTGERTSNYVFLRTLHDRETIKSFVANESIAANIASSPRLSFDCHMIVQLNREIINNARAKALSTPIMESLSKASKSLLSENRNTRKSAVWDLLFAIELALKSKIQIEGRIPSKKHNLLILLEESRIESAILHTWISNFPSDKEAINSRYGKGKDRSNRELFDIYHNCLKIISLITSLYDEECQYDNATFYLQKLPWQ